MSDPVNYNPGGVLWALFTHLPTMTDKDREDMRTLRTSIEGSVRIATGGEGTPSRTGIDVLTCLLWTASTVLELRYRLLEPRA